MSAVLLALAVLLLPAEAPWCGATKITGYSRFEHGSHTYDGTPILTGESIAAASWDVRMGSIAIVDGLGSFRVADRGGGLGNGDPLPWLDVAVWSRDEAFAITSVRTVCFRRPAA